MKLPRTACGVLGGPSGSGFGVQQLGTRLGHRMHHLKGTCVLSSGDVGNLWVYSRA